VTGLPSLGPRGEGLVVLQLIRTDMTFLKINSNYALVLQGFILIGVLVVASLIQMRRSRS